MRSRRSSRKGNTLIEFTLVGIPLIFVVVSTFEVARGMWLYHSLVYSIKLATRFASLHGQNCTIEPNHCAVTVGDIAQLIRSAGSGLDPSRMNVVFTDNTGSTLTCSMTDCLSDDTPWPPNNANMPGMRIGISAKYTFRSAISMFWPGASRQGPAPAIDFPASSVESIKF